MVLTYSMLLHADPLLTSLFRFRSIFNGIKAIKESSEKCDVVVVCDAVRPFIDHDTLMQVTLAAKEYGAAGAIRPLVSTVMCAKEDGFLDHSLDRTKHIASEMPQAFQFDVIYNGFSKATPYDFDHGTECLHVAQKYAGAKVKLISGGENLWKITYKKDLYAMEYMLKECERPNIILKGDWNETFLSVIQKGLMTKGIEVLYGSNTFCEDFKAEAFNGQNCVIHLLESKNLDDGLPELRSIVGSKVLIFLYVSEIEDSHTFEAWIQKSCQCTKSDVTHIGIMIIGKPNSQVVADVCLLKIPPLLEMVFDGNGGILHGQVLKFCAKSEF